MAISISIPSLKLLQWALMLFTFSVGAYIVYVLFGQPDPVLSAPIAASAQVAAPAFKLELKPYEEYASVIDARDLFNYSAVAVANAPADVPLPPSGELPANLKVVGILIGKPIQIMVEDTTTSQTYFIEQGKPRAGISVSHVEKDHVVIKYQDQSIAVPIKAQSQGALNAPTL